MNRSMIYWQSQIIFSYFWSFSSNKSSETTLKSVKNIDKVVPMKPTLQTVSNLPKLSQINGTHIEKKVSNESYYNKNDSLMDNYHPKMNFTSSIVMTSSTMPFNDYNNDMMRNVDALHTNSTSSFGSNSAVDSLPNCNYIKPKISQNIFVDNSTPNANILKINQHNSREIPEQIFGTKVTKRKTLFILYIFQKLTG